VNAISCRQYDFIPATDQPAFITPAGELIGEQVPGESGRWISFEYEQTDPVEIPTLGIVQTPLCAHFWGNQAW
jgi:hypothetical protein